MSQPEWRKASASNWNGNCVELAWHKASASTANGQCVEVAHCDQVHVRDSKRPEGGHLTVTREAFGRFLADLKAAR